MLNTSSICTPMSLKSRSTSILTKSRVFSVSMSLIMLGNLRFRLFRRLLHSAILSLTFLVNEKVYPVWFQQPSTKTPTSEWRETLRKNLSMRSQLVFTVLFFPLYRGKRQRCHLVTQLVEFCLLTQQMISKRRLISMRLAEARLLWNSKKKRVQTWTLTCLSSTCSSS